MKGLKGDPVVGEWLETRLASHEGVFRASASTTTGNILVLFHVRWGHEHIGDFLKEILDGLPFQEASHPDPSGQTQQAPSPTHPEPLPSEHARSSAPSLREKIAQRLFHRPQPLVAPWHILSADKALDLVQTDRVTGLTRDLARQRLREYGPNALPEAKERSRWEIFTNQFISLPVLLLGAAAGLSVLTGGLLDAAVILGVVAANAAIGYVTESEAEKTISSLKRSVHPLIDVVRDSRVQSVALEEVVVGDLLALKPGVYVAADSRVFESTHLSIDESILTGESMPVNKRHRALRAENLPIADRVNMAFMGTLVTGGEGLAVVVATGSLTEIGCLQKLLQETGRPETPMERRLRVLGDQLVLTCLGICGVVFALGFLRGYAFLQMLRMAVSLAAAAVPEGLPAAATINFALGIRRMRAHHILIRRLQAVETLGSVQTVCMDKTGTITQNQMTVVAFHVDMQRITVAAGQFRLERGPVAPESLPEFQPLLSISALCNESVVKKRHTNGDVELSGSPTENALILFAMRGGLDVLQVRQDFSLTRITYRSENRQFMSSHHRGPNGSRLLAVKGSPRSVLDLCQWQYRGGKRVALGEEDRLQIETENERMAGEALRVLGLAWSLNPEGDGKEPEIEKDLTWIGLVGMADPVRNGMNKVIEVFHRAGIDTVMITGDQSPTAYAVARELGLSRGEDPLTILDSMEFAQLQPDVMEALVQRVHVFSRVSPAHKLQIVQAFQKAGKTVAMTGDGINDGPALKAADIAIAMGTSGTDVAREVADVVLEDDNLETLVIALQEGRSTYRNIRKSVHFFLSTNMSEIMVMFTAIAAGIGFPLNIMQLLWINIISDIFPGIALSLGPPDPDVLEEAPRNPQEPLFSRTDFQRMAVESGVISAGCMSAYGVGAALYGLGPRASTMAFQSLTIGQLLHAFSCRSETRSLFDGEGPPANPYLNAAIGSSLGLQLLTMIFPPVRNFLGLTPISLLDAGVIAGAAVLPLLFNEAAKSKRKALK